LHYFLLVSSFYLNIYVPFFLFFYYFCLLIFSDPFLFFPFHAAQLRRSPLTHSEHT